MKKLLLIIGAAGIMCSTQLKAWEGMAMPRLHVEGRYLVDEQSNIVNLHGFAQTYSPWFNEKGSKWTGYDVSGCLSYNQGIIDTILAKGWKVNFMRLHMDPHWSNTPGKTVTGESDISAFSMNRFKTYFKSVFVPMAEYAISHGLYVIMRPPGVCPEEISVGDDYQKYLLDIWGYVAAQDEVRYNPNIMFELANEPVSIVNSDGSSAGFPEMKEYFQAIVDTIRTYCDNVAFVPGLGYQSNYAGFADNPIDGENIGYAVHCYPGWMNSGTEETPDVAYESFKAGWDAQIGPVAEFAPIVVTEMDWAPEDYGLSWGKGTTGEAGGTGFGANFKKIADEEGNVSWLIFTEGWLMAQFEDEQGEGNTFLTDQEACPWPTYHWYQEYATVNYPRPSFTYKSTSDQGNGTYKNPVIDGDFPDPDVLRVGDTYYMLTTTMHHFPGCTMLKSKDLVNWEYCANPMTRMSTYPEYNLEDGKNIYAKGMWAGALAYKDGKFYIMFNAFGNSDDGGGYLLSATDPEDTWTITKMSRGYYDPGMMVDDDGTIYVAFGNSVISVAQLDDNFEKVSETEVISGIDGLEGSRMFKKDGYYYIYATDPAWPAKQWIFRSTSPTGPYESKLVFDSDDIHQGQMIQTQTGEWWTMLMRDCGALGRKPYLEPVTWEDNWPVIGINGADATADTTYTKPNTGIAQSPKVLPTNDHFYNYKLGMQWQWNHNADNTKWSLLERTGWLRLYTASVTDSLPQARNTLTQRILGYSDDTQSYGTIKMDINNMADGDIAGLAVFHEPYAYIAVEKADGAYKVCVRGNASSFTDEEKAITPTNGTIWLRAITNSKTSRAKFYYSLDSINWNVLGSTLTMKYDLAVFVGNRFAIFNYATKELGGYVDIDWFSTEPTFTEDTYYDLSNVSYSLESLTSTGISISKEEMSVITGGSKTIELLATFEDGHTEDVGTEATYAIADESIATIKNGRISSDKEGTTSVTATYKDPLGNTYTTTFNVTSEVFPLTEEDLNASIYGEGTFDEETSTLTTTQYGFGGWIYTNGIDLSDYQYIVVKLNRKPANTIDFRIFEENNYWSDCASKTLGSRSVAIDLTTLTVGSSARVLDRSKVYIMGFWNCENGVIIKDVYLSNDGVTPTGIENIKAASDAIQEGDGIYDLSGRRIGTYGKSDNLQKGVYIINGKKVVIK